MSGRRIDLHIEQLTLEGFDTRDPYHVGLALQNELQRLFTEHGVPPLLEQGGVVPSLDGGVFNAGANAGPDAIGAQIAQRVYGGMKE